MTLARRPPVRMALIFWIFVLSAIGFLDRTNVSIAGPSIARELGIDNVRLGWIFSAFLVGYAAFQVVGGWLADRFGPRRALAYGVLWWGIFTALTAGPWPRLAHALLWLILVRGALGAGEAVIYPASNQFVARWIPVAERGRANGWIFAGVGAGAGLSLPVLAWIIERFGWRASFWFSAVLGLAAGLVWYLAARDTPEQHPWVSREELAHIQANRSPAPQPGGTPAAPLSWRLLIMNRNMMALTFSYFSYGYVAWIFFGWFLIYLAQVRGLDLKSSALFSTFPFLAMTIGCLAGGVATDWLTRRYGLRRGRCGLPVVVFLLTAGFLVLGSHAHRTWLASLVLAGAAGALYLGQSAYWAVSADIAGKHAGVASGFMNMGAQVGGALTASLTPYAASRYGWNAAFLLAASLAVAGGLLWLLIDPNQVLGAGKRHCGAAGLAPEQEPAGRGSAQTAGAEIL